jgi:hypothetical protein
LGIGLAVAYRLVPYVGSLASLLKSNALTQKRRPPLQVAVFYTMCLFSKDYMVPVPVVLGDVVVVLLFFVARRLFILVLRSMVLVPFIVPVPFMVPVPFIVPVPLFIVPLCMVPVVVPLCIVPGVAVPLCMVPVVVPLCIVPGVVVVGVV